jgi:hypothetical protein
LYADINVLEEQAASIFIIEMCRTRNWLLYRQAARKVAAETHGRVERNGTQSRIVGMLRWEMAHFNPKDKGIISL